MKTRIKILIVKAFAAILFLTAIAPASVYATENKPLKLYKILPFRKISVKGNVEVILIQRQAIGISYTDDNVGYAKVVQLGETLNITGTGKETSKLIIYVNDLFRIDAEENAVVRTDGMLTTRFLQVVLKGNAHADIHTKTQGLYTSIQDQSDLRLKGYTDRHFLFADEMPKLTVDGFVALHTQQD
ncbi:GIN domain-containing protein [Pedobacter punctiformis]|uniref:DUF2807 domain-containing protein n=1 Tax=Pedobacter punctiformis TaxID=3004097 RepID=A0ABT4L8Y8_9SPHI|nr:DUF2807 domain-containing protein [Pedobacter sp. HCMS5-2]MCZ4244384.1 DUF2807 domain-containing protein [Pedobacter sp. HCMS5-2]